MWKGEVSDENSLRRGEIQQFERVEAQALRVLITQWSSVRIRPLLFTNGRGKESD